MMILAWHFFLFSFFNKNNEYSILNYKGILLILVSCLPPSNEVFKKAFIISVASLYVINRAGIHAMFALLCLKYVKFFK